MTARVRPSWPAKAYVLLLRAYPPSHRARFAEDMRQTFLRDYASVRRAGVLRLAAFWAVTVTQAVWYGFAERRTADRDLSTVSVRQRGALHVSTALKLLRSPAEVPAMVIALSLGVGLTTAVYTLIHAVLLTPPPWADPERVVQVWQVATEEPGERTLPRPVQDALVQATSPFERLASYRSLTQPLRTDADSRQAQVRGALVSVEIFDVLGVRAARGRIFQPQDARLAETPPIIISERLMRSGMASSGLDDIIEVNGQRHHVVGVMADAFWFPDRDTQYWVPITDPTLGLGAVATWNAPVIARLAAGVTPAVAASQAAAQLSGPGLAPERLRVESYWSLLTAPVRPALLVLQAASGLVLLLVCVNVGWLFVARVQRLRPTFSTMRALGASSGRLLGTHVITAIAVAALAVPVSVLVAWVLLRWGLALDSGVFSQIATPAIGWHVVVIAAVTTAVASLASAAPAAFSLGRSTRFLSDWGRPTTGGCPVGRTAVAVQIALVFAVGAQAVFFANVLQRLVHTNVGFDITDLVVVGLERPGAETVDPVAELSGYKSVLSELQQRGVRAALTNTFPLTGSDFGMVFGRRVSREAQRGTTRTRVVTPSYFQVTGLRATAGRVLTEADAGSGRAVVTGTPAAYSGDTRRLGETVGIDSGWTIVGIVPPLRQFDFYESLLPEAYLLYDDVIVRGPSPDVLSRTYIVADVASGTGATLDAIRATIAAELPAVEIRSTFHLDDLIAAGLGPRRLVAAGASTFAIVALVLAAIGLHGMVSHGLIRRGREIGVRMALGATPFRIAAESVRALGVVYAIGTAAGFAVLVSARSTLQAVMVPPPGDPYPSLSLVAATAGAVLLAAIAATCYRPVRTATAIDPAVVLRMD